MTAESRLEQVEHELADVTSRLRRLEAEVLPGSVLPPDWGPKPIHARQPGAPRADASVPSRPLRPSEVRPGRLVAARAGCGRHETPGT